MAVTFHFFSDINFAKIKIDTELFHLLFHYVTNAPIFVISVVVT